MDETTVHSPKNVATIVQIEMDDGDKLRGFNWADPTLKDVTSLERFCSRLIHSPDNMPFGSHVRKLDLRAFDALRYSDLISTVSSLEGLSEEALVDLVQEDLSRLKLIFGKLETLSVELQCVDPSVLSFISNASHMNLKKVEILASESQHLAQESEITESIVSMFSQCQNLESVNLEGFLHNGSLLNEDNAGVVISAIGRWLPRLKVLRTPTKVAIDAKQLSGLLACCPALEDLALLKIPDASDQAAVELVKSLIYNGQSLRNVSFGLDDGPDSNPVHTKPEDIHTKTINPQPLLEPTIFEFLERRGRSLRGLEIRGWPSSDRLLRTVAKHCTLLDLLFLSPCSGIRSEAAIRDVLTRTRTLRYLKLDQTLPSASAAAVLACDEVKSRGGCDRERLTIGRVGL
ncbi:hypothetical protein HDU67_006417 [Dinochytrium kinnereticum]|nr:hypothetical protein HDU67_006417 [Dinochytrium kinnereticum]